jgi:hypothetical protein
MKETFCAVCASAIFYHGLFIQLVLGQWRVAVLRSDTVTAVDGDSSAIQRKGNVRALKLLPRNE